MIRTTRHSISKFANGQKLSLIDELFRLYKIDLQIYVNYIVDGILPLAKNLSSKLLPIENIEHSRYRQLIYKQASEIVRSQMKKSSDNRFKTYKKVYFYFKEQGRQASFTSKKFSELSLSDVIKTRYFTTPVVKNITINLDERFFDIKFDSIEFDGFVKIILPFFNEKKTRAIQIKIPLRHHKHSIKFSNGGFEMKKVIQLKKTDGRVFMNLVWEKEVVPKEISGKSIGIDVGYRQLIATSDGQMIGKEMMDIYKKVVDKQKNSNAQKRAFRERDSLINYFVGQIDFSEVSKVCVEDLCNIKYKSKYNNKTNDLMARWTYRPLLDRIEMTCEAKGILLVKVSPAYTSQMCSSCGHVSKENRNGDFFVCMNCEMKMNADLNATINIRNKGAMVPLSKKELNVNLSSLKDKCYD